MPDSNDPFAKWRKQPDPAPEAEVKTDPFSKWRKKSEPEATPEPEKELPVVQEQAVSGLTRAGLKNLIDESPELQLQYLERKGWDARERGGQIQVKRPGDKEWRVVDPKGFDLQDVTDHIADVLQGAAMVAGISTGGILGGAGAGTLSEAARQGVGKLAGFREEMDTGAIGVAGALGAAGGASRGAVAAGQKASQAVAKKLAVPAKALRKIAAKIDEVVPNLGTRILNTADVVSGARAARFGAHVAGKVIPKAEKVAEGALVPIAKRIEDTKKERK